ncbi:hypothetical protein M758_8G046400 [Ceratodon purpureus]|uniref:Uncharacterized protein n=1 Tax=Ceratodon purpureus TaxID=3225 RepID=A0A8T0GYW6_CERPU|nr:hypothetical protein KC19_8G048300 [Ceratodon purpureus]KAG0607663.1 hypothetical protein M758_8G046400 [Ceratodon purpureus]
MILQADTGFAFFNAQVILLQLLKFGVRSFAISLTSQVFHRNCNARRSILEFNFSCKRCTQCFCRFFLESCLWKVDFAQLNYALLSPQDRPPRSCLRNSTLRASILSHSVLTV